MPYKTKFREIEMPKTAAEMQALSGDANSLRSLGAANYRKLNQVYPKSEMCYVMASMFVITEKVTEKLSQGALGDHNEKGMAYFMDGVRRAARQSGDLNTAGHLHDRIAEIKGKL